MALMTIYEHVNFGGASRQINQSFERLGDFNNRITSAVVHSGTWEVYRGSNYTGRSMTLTPGEYRNLSTLGNDTISSIKLVRG